MKAASSQLATHIAGGVTTLATCWKVTRLDESVFGFTDHDQDIVFSGVTYAAATGYTRSAIHTIANLAVDNLDIESILESDVMSAADLRSGIWDGAEVEIFMVNWADLTQGRIILKRGRIGEVELKSPTFRAELRGLTQQLSQQIVELYTPDCRAELGDSRCGVNLAALTVTGAVTASAGRYSFTDSARAEAADYWNGGVLTWLTGDNVGRSMEVKTFSAGVVGLFLPMPAAIAVGDTYSLKPGCDKSLAMCKNRYNNVLNFRGEPHVPGTDQVLSYPDAK